MAKISLHVLGKFELVLGSESVSVGTSCQRLLTLLAIKDGRVNRTQAAGMLWPEVTMARANANLRSVLWRLRRCCCDVVEGSFYDLRLSTEVVVDMNHVNEFAQRLLDRSTPKSAAELKQALQCNFYDDLVPDLGDEEWLQMERERFLQIRLHSLEALSEHFVRVGWYGAAVEAALGATHADPFRESARYFLINAHLSEGNQIEARRQYMIYRDLLLRELGVEPSEHLVRLMRDRAARPARPSAPRIAPRM